LSLPDKGRWGQGGWGDGGMGGWGDGEMGRWGDGGMGRWGKSFYYLFYSPYLLVPFL